MKYCLILLLLTLSSCTIYHGNGETLITSANVGFTTNRQTTSDTRANGVMSGAYGDNVSTISTVNPTGQPSLEIGSLVMTGTVDHSTSIGAFGYHLVKYTRLTVAGKVLTTGIGAAKSVGKEFAP